MNSELPKVLVDLAGQPLIRHLLNQVERVQGDYTPIIVTGFKRELVEAELGEKYIYAVQHEQLGTAHAAASGLEKVEADNVLILYGDMPLIPSETLRELCSIHETSGSLFSMLTATPPHFENEFQSLYTFGRILRDGEGKIAIIRELVDTNDEEKKIHEVNPGFYIFNTQWLRENIGRVKQNSHGEQYLTDMVAEAVAQGINITTVPVSPLCVLGVNTPEQLVQAEHILAQTFSS